MACGGFHTIEFTSTYGPERTYHASKFFGSGVVMAYLAEQSGKGLRVFLSRSLASAIEDAGPWVATPLDQSNDECQFEVNLVHWPHRGQAVKRHWVLSEFAAQMATAAPNSRSVQLQYTETKTALDLMLEH